MSFLLSILSDFLAEIAVVGLLALLGWLFYRLSGKELLDRLWFRLREGRLGSSQYALFRAGEFVDQERTITFIRRNVERIRTGRVPFASVIEYYGLAGNGKSTLLREVQARCRTRGVTCVLYDFTIDERLDHISVMKTIIGRLHGTLRKTSKRKVQASWEECKRRLEDYKKEESRTRNALYLEKLKDEVRQASVNYLDQVLQGGPLLFLLDGSELATGAVNWLGRQVISNLLDQEHGRKRLLVILAGREPMDWDERLIQEWKVHREQLEPLEQGAFRFILHKKYHPLADTLYELTLGYPPAIQRVFEELDRLDQGSVLIGAHNIDLYKPRLASISMQALVESYLTRGEAHLRRLFELAAVLRRFDSTIFLHLFSNCVPPVASGGSNVLNYIQLMREMRFVHRNGEGFYRPASQIRRFVLSRLLTDQDEYIQRNELALNIYAESMATPNGRSAVYSLERLYHRSCIWKVAPPEKTKTVREELEDCLTLLRDQKASAGTLVRLRGLLKEDEELRDNLPPGLCDELCSMIG